MATGTYAVDLGSPRWGGISGAQPNISTWRRSRQRWLTRISPRTRLMALAVLGLPLVAPSCIPARLTGAHCSACH